MISVVTAIKIAANNRIAPFEEGGKWGAVIFSGDFPAVTIHAQFDTQSEAETASNEVVQSAIDWYQENTKES